jgi:hypothetical protein
MSTDVDAARDGRSDDRTYRGVHAGRVATASDHRDFVHAGIVVSTCIGQQFQNRHLADRCLAKPEKGV